MKERDLITIDQRINHDPDDYAKMWTYSGQDMDESVYKDLFYEIFNRQKDFFKKFQYYFDKKWNKNTDGEVFEMVLYYIKYKKEIRPIYGNIEDCCNDIESQISEINDEIKSLGEEMLNSNDEFDSCISKICDITGSREIVMKSTGLYKDLIQSWGLSTLGLGEDKQREVDDLMSDAESWKDEYWEKEEEKNNLKDLLEIAKTNLTNAKDHRDRLEEVMYDV